MVNLKANLQGQGKEQDGLGGRQNNRWEDAIGMGFGDSVKGNVERYCCNIINNIIFKVKGLRRDETYYYIDSCLTDDVEKKVNTTWID